MKAQHDGQRSTYAITKEGKKFTLHPNLDSTNDKEDKPKVMIVGEKEMLQTLKNEKVGFALVLNPKDVVDRKGKEIPKEIQELLQ